MNDLCHLYNESEIGTFYKTCRKLLLIVKSACLNRDYIRLCIVMYSESTPILTLV